MGLCVSLTFPIIIFKQQIQKYNFFKKNTKHTHTTFLFVLFSIFFFILFIYFFLLYYINVYISPPQPPTTNSIHSFIHPFIYPYQQEKEGVIWRVYIIWVYVIYTVILNIFLGEWNIL